MWIYINELVDFVDIRIKVGFEASDLNLPIYTIHFTVPFT